MLEVTELLARGSAAASLRLLWQLHLLDPLFPSLARRFQAARLPRCARCARCPSLRLQRAMRGLHAWHNRACKGWGGWGQGARARCGAAGPGV